MDLVKYLLYCNRSASCRASAAFGIGLVSIEDAGRSAVRRREQQVCKHPVLYQQRYTPADPQLYWLWICILLVCLSFTLSEPHFFGIARELRAIGACHIPTLRLTEQANLSSSCPSISAV